MPLALVQILVQEPHLDPPAAQRPRAAASLGAQRRGTGWLGSGALTWARGGVSHALKRCGGGVQDWKVVLWDALIPIPEHHQHFLLCGIWCWVSLSWCDGVLRAVVCVRWDEPAWVPQRHVRWGRSVVVGIDIFVSESCESYLNACTCKVACAYYRRPNHRLLSTAPQSQVS